MTTDLQLTLIIPSTHEAVGRDGLLQERTFSAGPCTITVLSVLTHHEAGQFTIRRNKPEIQVRHNNEFLDFANPGQSIEAFSATFAAALRDAEIHAMKVEQFINNHVVLLAKAAAISDNVRNAGTITTTLLEVSGYLKRVRDGEQKAMAQNAGELFDKLGKLFL